MPSTTIDPHKVARRLIGDLDPTLVGLLASDPVDTIEELVGIPVGYRPASPTGGTCGVDGAYHPGPPPRIVIAEDTIVTKQFFTVLHEYGHHLIEHDIELNKIGLSDDDRRVEDVADAVAAALLLADPLIEQTLTSRPPTPRQISELVVRSSASRSACCVAAAQRLGRHGCVLLTDAQGTVFFAAHQPATQWRIARGAAQGETSLVGRAARRPGTLLSDRGSVRFGDGRPTSPLWGRAYADADGWTYGVFVEDTVNPWAPATGLHLPTRDDDWGEEYECPHCDLTFESRAKPCDRCGAPKHEACGRCLCTLSKFKSCAICGLPVPQNLFPGGGDTCADCF